MEDSDRKSGPLSRITLVTVAGRALSESVDILLTDAFGVPQSGPIKNSYYDDFPVWSPGDCSSAQLYAGLDSMDRLLGCAGLRVAQLLTVGGDTIRLGIVGAVATTRSSRGLGVGSGLVHFCVERARESGCQAIVLWDSSESSMYRRLGFQEFGTQCLMRLSDFPTPGGGVPSAVAGTGWRDDLLGLLQQRGSGLLLTDSDISWMRRHRNVKWYWLERRGVLSAACAAGRGIDLQGVVHEWHGSAESLGLVFKQVLAEDPGALLMGPEMGDITLQAHRMAMGMYLPLVPGIDPGNWWFWGLDSA